MGCGVRVQGVGSKVYGFCCGVYGEGFRVLSSGAWGLRLKVLSSGY